MNLIESGSDIITIRDGTTPPCECETVSEQAAANRETEPVIVAVLMTCCDEMLHVLLLSPCQLSTVQQ